MSRSRNGTSEGARYMAGLLFVPPRRVCEGYLDEGRDGRGRRQNPEDWSMRRMHGRGDRRPRIPWISSAFASRLAVRVVGKKVKCVDVQRPVAEPSVELSLSYPAESARREQGERLQIATTAAHMAFGPPAITAEHRPEPARLSVPGGRRWSHSRRQDSQLVRRRSAVIACERGLEPWTPPYHGFAGLRPLCSTTAPQLDAKPFSTLTTSNHVFDAIRLPARFPWPAHWASGTLVRAGTAP